jgi:hypothetical protein
VTPEATAAAAAAPIGALGGAFMISRATLKKGPAMGLPKGWAFYFGGRGGVLGDVVPDVVAAAFVFFPVETVRTHWLEARAVLDPAAAAAAYAEACQAWGREHLSEIADLDRLVELLRRVIADISPAGAPLFAGWRALPLPQDEPGAAAHMLQVLREFRGAMHGVAVLAEGLTPLEAVLISGGEANASFFGWEAPYPEVEELRDKHRAAEKRTDHMAARAFTSLYDGERRELIGLLEEARSVLPT